jgi:hypothetical protein
MIQLFQAAKAVMLKSWMLPAIVIGGLWSVPVQAQSDAEVFALVEALRLAAPDTGIENDGLYSDWQIKAENIEDWSKFCKQPATVSEFAQDFELAQSIVTCVVADLLYEEYGASGNNIDEAVLRSASWWMTGDSTAYLNDSTIEEYVLGILNFFNEQFK